jgi:hypothetical protein
MSSVQRLGDFVSSLEEQAAWRQLYGPEWRNVTREQALAMREQKRDEVARLTAELDQLEAGADDDAS